MRKQKKAAGRAGPRVLRVRCCGEWHRLRVPAVGAAKARTARAEERHRAVALDHTPRELEAERVQQALGGVGCGCAAVLAEVSRRTGRAFVSGYDYQRLRRAVRLHNAEAARREGRARRGGD